MIGLTRAALNSVLVRNQPYNPPIFVPKHLREFNISTNILAEQRRLAFLTQQNGTWENNTWIIQNRDGVRHVFAPKDATYYCSQLQSLKMCFVGDSQLRELSLVLAGLLGATTSQMWDPKSGEPFRYLFIFSKKDLQEDIL